LNIPVQSDLSRLVVSEVEPAKSREVEGFNPCKNLSVQFRFELRKLAQNSLEAVFEFV